MRTTFRLISLAAIAGLTAISNPAAALDIALTNDDGWNAMGIQTMKAALETAGHTVTLAAPLTDQSGASMALDQAGLIVKKQQGTRTYSVALAGSNPAVGAKPANSANVAIGIVQEGGRSPDLLISGINTSANIGLMALLSGTVGAASHALVSVPNGPVPAIAISTHEPSCDTTCKQAHYQVVANFMVRFVAHLQTKPGFLASEFGLLPKGVGLMIAYPGTDSVRGVKVAVQSDSVMQNGQKVSGEIKCSEPCSAMTEEGQFRVAVPMLAPDYTPEPADSDLSYFSEGYITIVPITPDITANNPHRFKSILPGFKM